MIALVQWQSPRMIGIALLVGVLVTLAVGLLYPAQTRAVSGAWRWTLPALRIAALAALAVSVARPVAQRTLTEEEQGAVVVLVDKSRSMGVKDQQRTPAMLVALADGLGKIPAGVRSRNDAFAQILPDIERLPGLLDAILQPQNELVVAQLQGRQNPAAQKRLDEAAAEFTRVTKSLAAQRAAIKTRTGLTEALARLERLPPVTAREWQATATTVINLVADRAAQFQAETDDALYRSNEDVRAACDRLGAMHRLDLVEEALLNPSRGLLAAVPARAPLFGYSVGAGAVPLPLRSAGQVVRRLMLDPDDVRSDLSLGLRDVMEQLRHQPIQAVLLFSDGRQVGNDTSIASSLAGSSVPVYTIAAAPIGPGAMVRDVGIEQIDMPASLFIGETLRVTASIGWSGMKSTPKEVVLQVGEQTVRAPIREGRKPNVEVYLTVSEPGAQRVTLSVPAVEGEASTRNNSVTRWVKVLSDKFDVLLVGGSPTWDFRYLRDALSGTQWMNTRTLLLDQPKAPLAATPEQIEAQDVVILCDVPAAAISAPQWESLRRMVAQRGGSVILIAGQAHLPREYTSDTAAEFLPYRRSSSRAGANPLWRLWPGEEPEFRIVPAPEVSPIESIALDVQGGDITEQWMALPPLFRFLEMAELKESVQPLLVERGTGSAVLTRQRLGRGKVFFLGIDETWRWRYKVGDKHQYRFFRQLVRNAADEPYATTNDAVSLDADRVTASPGQKIHVRARLLNPIGDPAESRGLDVDVVRDGRVVSTLRLSPVGVEGSGRYEGDLSGLETGEYLLRAKPPTGGELEYPLHVVESDEAELANLNVDEDYLRRLATSSGGQFFTLEQLKALAPRLAELRQKQAKTAELRLWSSWYLYAFVLSCLGLEWAIRKRLGLA